jgi:hydroxymethylpyrimidine pyrophosphatase-like HAD family hydrolase
MILAIDFDGTICRGKFPAIDGQQPYAADTVNSLYDAGHYIIINTCRSGEQLLEAINWMLNQGIKFHRVNDNHPEQTALYNNNSRKIYAHLYIDDKNLGGFPGWLQAHELIKEQQWKENEKQNARSVAST